MTSAWRTLWAALLALILLESSAWAQNSVQQDGVVVPGHIASWSSKGHLQDSGILLLSNVGTVVTIQAPSTAFAAKPAFGNYTTPWTVKRPDGVAIDCAGTIANCVDKVFADPATRNNWSIEIACGGGQFGSNNQVAINGGLAFPVLRSQYFLSKGCSFTGLGPGAAAVLIDSMLTAEARWLGGQISSTDYTDATLLIQPTQTVLPEGFPGNFGKMYLPAIAHDASAAATFTGSISGTTLTVPNGTSLAAGQIINGTNVVNNTKITSGSGTSWTVDKSQSVSSTTITAYNVAASTLHQSVSSASITEGLLDTPEVNGAGAGGIPTVKQAVLIDGATANTGVINQNEHYGFIHQCTTACFQEGTGTGNQSNYRLNTRVIDEISPSNGATGVSTWGTLNKWWVNVDSNAIGSVGSPTVAAGFVLQGGANNNEVHLSCRGTFTVCLQISGADTGSFDNLIFVETAGAVTTAVLDGLNGTGRNTIYVNGKLLQQAWTPALQFGGAAVGITYGTQTGNFTNAGGVITADFNLVLTAKGSSTGAATITGLPYAENGSYVGQCVVNYYANLASLSGPVMGYINASAATVNLEFPGATGVGNLADTNFTATSQVKGSCLYHTS
jgi:hypothetical protein